MSMRIALFCCGLLLSCSSGLANEIYYRNESIAVFGGRFTTGTMSESAFFGTTYDNSYVVAVSYSRKLFDLGLGFFVDGEIGLAGRFGDGNSAEVWLGPRLRYRGVSVGNVFTLSPSITFGLSAVTSPIGIERARELQYGGNAALLLYLSPEIALFFHSLPHLEFFYRLHHRSGAFGTFGKLHEGANANVVGVRYWLASGLFR